MARERPAHVIDPDEVDAWLADSAVKIVTVHRTTWEAADDISARGVDLALSRDDAGWGRGFYSRTDADPAYGPATIAVAVRLRRPLEVMDSVRDAGILDVLTAQAGTEDFRSAIIAAGYDGVVVHYDQQLAVVAFWSEQVKIVVRDDDKP